ncbi:MAG TPA: methyltransferase domain-containing protein [Terriglobales bacterium]|nr:methyltransferase domain-containing protein [Terriglobales bacterium]
MSHRDRILDQFTRQAVPFAGAAPIRDQAALDRVVQAAGTGPEDTALDVGCGPGLLACAFARVVRHATGIDLTPAMLEQARKLQREQGLTNVTWQQGDITSLLFSDNEFSIVSCRYVFHHLEDPLTVLKEMARVCRPGGRVVVVDMAPAPEKADALNRMERLRDPSHVRGLTLFELRDLFKRTGLPEPGVQKYRMECELEDLLSRSFPEPGDADRIRKMVQDSLEDDALDLAVRKERDTIYYAYPVVILVSTPE